jgi:hypothetical protein
MSTQRITVCVPTEIAIRVKRAARRTGSVSAWVTRAVTRTLAEEDSKRRFLEFCDAVNATPAEERKAKAAFDQISRSQERKKSNESEGAEGAKARRRDKTPP